MNNASIERTEDELRQVISQLNERVKELSLLYRISALADDPSADLPNYLQRVVDLLPSGWQYAGDACAQITLNGQDYATANWQPGLPASQKQRQAIVVEGQEVGSLALGYLSEHGPAGEEPFLEEERALIEEIARQVGQFVMRVRANQAVQRSLERFRYLFENSPVALFVQDFSAVKRYIARLQEQGLPDPRAHFESHPAAVAQCLSLVENLDLNQASLELYGAADRAELLTGLDFFVPAEAHAMFIDELVWIAQGRTRFEWEGVNRRLDGHLIHIHLQWSAAPGYEETLERVLVAIEDITARKQAEADLQASEARYRAVSELTSDFAFTMRVNPDQTLHTEWVTDAFARITGFSFAEAEMAGGWLRFIHPEDRAAVGQAIQQVLAGQQAVIEARLLTREGSPRWVRFHGRPELDPATGRVSRVRGAGQDVTDTRRMEQEMIHAERLAAMGQVMATLAHEVKNPLQSLHANLELLSDFPLERDEREETVRICQEEVGRLIDITQNVLSLSRTGPEDYQPVAIARAWRRTGELLERQIGEAGISLDVDLPVDLPYVRGSLEQLMQVMLNLTLNAIESMPAGGHLDVTARHSEENVVITFVNDGPPIPTEHLPLLYEPFFTTKPAGTGLGLFICNTILQQHGGGLSTSNLPGGVGVRHTVTLPIALANAVQHEVSQ